MAPWVPLKEQAFHDLVPDAEKNHRLRLMEAHLLATLQVSGTYILLVGVAQVRTQRVSFPHTHRRICRNSSACDNHGRQDPVPEDCRRRDPVGYGVRG